MRRYFKHPMGRTLSHQTFYIANLRPLPSPSSLDSLAALLGPHRLLPTQTARRHRSHGEQIGAELGAVQVFGHVELRPLSLLFGKLVPLPHLPLLRTKIAVRFPSILIQREARPPDKVLHLAIPVSFGKDVLDLKLRVFVMLILHGRR